MRHAPIPIHLIAGARPNFMKVAPLYHAMSRETWCRPVLVHTGQHYDADMSDAFFRDLKLPEPAYHLGVGSGSHAEQTAGVMVAYERICNAEPPAWTIVVGDVNSTLACALVVKKLCRPLAHLEAGLRSRDWTMPEEVNRIVTDALADLLWTPSPDADENLRGEGVAEDRISRVGNIMIDSYELLHQQIAAQKTRERFGLGKREFGVVTLHRPSNVDEAETLSLLVSQLTEVAAKVPLVFSVHPRTRERLKSFGLYERLDGAEGIELTDPMSYVQFMGLVREARMIITDSGGIQEETTYLNIPCLTLRDTTERPITISQGTNELVAPDRLAEAVSRVARGEWLQGRCPELWDGHTAERVVADLAAGNNRGQYTNF